MQSDAIYSTVVRSDGSTATCATLLDRDAWSRRRQVSCCAMSGPRGWTRCSQPDPPGGHEEAARGCSRLLESSSRDRGPVRARGRRVLACPSSSTAVVRQRCQEAARCLKIAERFYASWVSDARADDTASDLSDSSYRARSRCSAATRVAAFSSSAPCHRRPPGPVGEPARRGNPCYSGRGQKGPRQPLCSPPRPPPQSSKAAQP